MPDRACGFDSHLRHQYLQLLTVVLNLANSSHSYVSNYILTEANFVNGYSSQSLRSNHHGKFSIKSRKLLWDI